jgi:flavin reductase (DIM6/NTAB) family NADH-FMN oxidoreductase RutF
MAIKNSQEVITNEEFRFAMSSWATGISVITCMSSDNPQQPIAIVCNSIVSISLTEKLILWSVDKSSSSYQQWIQAPTFLINILAEDQGGLVGRFAKKGPGKFEGLKYLCTERGNPILEGASVSMECSTTQIVDTPDHSLIISRLETLVNNNKAPLIYLHSSSWSSTQLKTKADKGNP